MSENKKCLRCGKILKNEESIKRQFGKRCYRIHLLEEKENKPNEELIELKNKYNQLSLKLTILERKLVKLQEKGVSTTESIERIKPEIDKPKTPEQMNFTIVINELKMIFKGENFNYHSILCPIEPRTQIEIPPILEIVKITN